MKRFGNEALSAAIAAHDVLASGRLPPGANAKRSTSASSERSSSGGTSTSAATPPLSAGVTVAVVCAGVSCSTRRAFAAVSSSGREEITTRTCGGSARSDGSHSNLRAPSAASSSFTPSNTSSMRFANRCSCRYRVSWFARLRSSCVRVSQVELYDHLYAFPFM